MVVLPGATLVTTPAPLTVATPVLLLVHAPPLFPLALKLRADPTHTDDPPLITPAFNTGFTATFADALMVPHKPPTV